MCTRVQMSKFIFIISVNVQLGKFIFIICRDVRLEKFMFIICRDVQLEQVCIRYWCKVRKICTIVYYIFECLEPIWVAIIVMTIPVHRLFSFNFSEKK